MVVGVRDSCTAPQKRDNGPRTLERFPPLVFGDLPSLRAVPPLCIPCSLQGRRLSARTWSGIAAPVSLGLPRGCVFSPARDHVIPIAAKSAMMIPVSNAIPPTAKLANPPDNPQGKTRRARDPQRLRRVFLFPGGAISSGGSGPAPRGHLPRCPRRNRACRELRGFRRGSVNRRSLPGRRSPCGSMPRDSAASRRRN